MTVTGTDSWALPAWSEWDEAIDSLQPGYDALEKLVWRLRENLTGGLDHPVTFEHIGQLWAVSNYIGNQADQLRDLADRIESELARVDEERMGSSNA
jgi:hypothetical protein